MKVRRYKNSSWVALIGSLAFAIYFGMRAYYESYLLPFLVSLPFGIPVGLILGLHLVRTIKSRVRENTVLFSKMEKLRNVVYALLLVNVLLILSVAAFALILLKKAEMPIDRIIINVYYISNVILGLLMGILLTATLFQHVWIELWERRHKTTLLEIEESEK